MILDALLAAHPESVEIMQFAADELPDGPPLDAVAVLRVPGHWCYVSLGCAERTRPGRPLRELVVRVEADGAPPRWPAELIGGAAQWLAGRKPVAEGSYVYLDPDPAFPGIDGVAVVPDRALSRPVATPLGPVAVLQIVTLRDADLAAMESWRADRVLDMIAVRDRWVQAGVDRPAIVEAPALGARIGRMMARDAEPRRHVEVRGLTWDEHRQPPEIRIPRRAAPQLGALIRARAGAPVVLGDASTLTHEVWIEPAATNAWRTESNELLALALDAATALRVGDAIGRGEDLELPGLPRIAVVPPVARPPVAVPALPVALDPISQSVLDGVLAAHPGAELAACFDAAAIWSEPPGPAPFRAVAVLRVADHRYYVTLGCAAADRPPALHELTLRLGGGGDPPTWPARLLWNLGARWLFGGVPLTFDDIMPLTSKLPGYPELAALGLTLDPGLDAPVATPRGAVQLVQLVTLYAEEMSVIRSWRADAVLTFLAVRDRWLVSCAPRVSLLEDDALVARIGTAIGRDIVPQDPIEVLGLTWTFGTITELAIPRASAVLLAAVIRARIDAGVPILLYDSIDQPSRNAVLQFATADRCVEDGPRLAVVLTRGSGAQLADELMHRPDSIALPALRVVLR